MTIKNKNVFILSLLTLVSTLVVSVRASAAVILSQSSFVAGKASVLTVQNGGVDVTSTSTLSYAGPEIRIGTFAGKPYIQGITSGSNYDIIVKDTLSGTLLGDVLVSVTPGSYYKLAVVSGDSQSVAEGMAPTTSLVVQTQDMYRNAVTGQSVAVTMPSGSSLNFTSDGSGYVTIPYSSGGNAGSESITASSGYSNVSFYERIVPGINGLSSIALSGVPDSIDVGTSFSATASLFDSTSAAVLGAYSVKMAAYTDSTCSFISPNITTQTLINSNGVVSFSGLVDSTIEKLYIGVFSGGLGACSRALTVNPALSTVSKLAFTQTPSSGKNGISLFPPTSVQLLDVNNRLVTSSSDSVTVLAYSDSSCSTALPAANNTKVASSGQMTLNALQITTVGSAYIQAADAGFKSTCYGPISIASAVAAPLADYALTSIPDGLTGFVRGGYNGNINIDSGNNADGSARPGPSTFDFGQTAPSSIILYAFLLDAVDVTVDGVTTRYNTNPIGNTAIFNSVASPGRAITVKPVHNAAQLSNKVTYLNDSGNGFVRAGFDTAAQIDLGRYPNGADRPGPATYTQLGPVSNLIISCYYLSGITVVIDGVSSTKTCNISGTTDFPNIPLSAGVNHVVTIAPVRP